MGPTPPASRHGAAGPELGTTSCVILGLVANRSGSGYDIAARAARTIAHFWPISRSQVYAELSRLEAAGLIDGTHVEQDRRPDKRRYELTAGGTRAVDAWVEAPGYPFERSRNGLLAKFFFADRMSPEQRARLLGEYRAQADGQRRELEAVVERLAGEDAYRYGRATALFGLLNAEARVAWADHMLAVENGTAELGDVDMLGAAAAARRRLPDHA
jgi:PadR family transcriptional regulator AphA